MELSLMLQRLWRLRLLVAVGVIVAVALAVLTVAHVSLSPFSVQTKKSSSGAAETTLYVDTGNAAVITGQSDTASLVARAQILARYINSGAVRRAAARQLGIPAREIAVTGPNPDTPGQTTVQPAAQQRANALLSSGSPWTVFIDTEQNSPTFTLFTQAPTGADAVGLARAVTSALQQTLTSLQVQQRPALERALRDQIRTTESRENRTVSAPERREDRRALFNSQAVVRQLGDPVGGEVAEQTRSAIAVGVFVAVLLVWCAALLVLSGIARSTRRR